MPPIISSCTAQLPQEGIPDLSSTPNVCLLGPSASDSPHLHFTFGGFGWLLMFQVQPSQLRNQLSLLPFALLCSKSTNLPKRPSREYKDLAHSTSQEFSPLVQSPVGGPSLPLPTSSSSYSSILSMAEHRLACQPLPWDISRAEEWTLGAQRELKSAAPKVRVTWSSIYHQLAQWFQQLGCVLWKIMCQKFNPQLHGVWRWDI